MKVCGRNLYDDFFEIIPGAVRELEKSLDFSHHPVRNVSPGNEGSTSARPQDNTRAFQELTEAQESHTSSIHPMGSEQQQSWGSVVRRRRKGFNNSMGSDEVGKWILPIFQEKRYGAKAVHLPVKHIDSDETFFMAMKEHYFASTTRLHRWFSMRDVKKIHHVKVRSARVQGTIQRLKFLQFVLTYRGADVAKFNDWPPQQSSVPKGQWIYEGCPKIKRRPLISTGYMMHLWQYPHHSSLKSYQAHTPGCFQRARDTLFNVRTRCRNYLRDRVSRPSDDPVSDIPDSLQDRSSAAAGSNGEARQDHHGSSTNRHDETADIELQATEPPRDCYVFLHTPKKLGEKLTPDDRDPPEGWGIYFEEGFCIPPFFVVMYCVCLLGSLALAIFWYHTYGLAAFGVLGWVVGLLSLFATVLFKWAD